MKNSIYILLISLFFIKIECNISSKDDSLITDETKAVEYLEKVNKELQEQMQIYSEAQWEYATNITDATSDAQMKAIEVFNAFQKVQSSNTLKYNWTYFAETNRRQFEKLAIIGTSALEGEDEKTFVTVTNRMESNYSSATICVQGDCGLELDPELDEIMATSNDYEKLKETWVKWREASGKLMRNDFITYYTLGNKAAKMNKLPDKEFDTLDDLWLFPWETPDIKEQTAELWEQLLPFYKKLHAYIRIKLTDAYPNEMPKDYTIPAHLLGNMWAQQWSNIMKTVEGVDPYPEIPAIDVTEALQNQKFDSIRMFNLSDDFFGNLGLDRMTEKFWVKSVIDKRNNTVMVCHASAWDFYSLEEDDFRIKQCTNVNMEDLITIHHEMGHIEYFMQYKHLPVVYREGANPGFHEAIGDLLALSVSTPKHLAKLGLYNMSDAAPEVLAKINLKFQLKMALDKLAFLPFGYIMDKWRWDLFSGEVSSDHMNEHWWKLRGEYQGLSPPVKRSENDFDPGAKYHIPASVEYIRYFVSHILQFQFHKALCSYSQKDVPIHECDIDGDTEAGKELKNVLALGSSKKWPEQLKQLTGSDKMDVKPLLEYFAPLEKFLDKELGHEIVGWTYNVNDYFDRSSGRSSQAINVLSLIICTIIPFIFIIM